MLFAERNPQNHWLRIIMRMPLMTETAQVNMKSGGFALSVGKANPVKIAVITAIMNMNKTPILPTTSRSKSITRSISYYRISRLQTEVTASQKRVPFGTWGLR
jgi:hypothetical protein